MDYPSGDRHALEGFVAQDPGKVGWRSTANPWGSFVSNRPSRLHFIHDYNIIALFGYLAYMPSPYAMLDPEFSFPRYRSRDIFI